MERELIQLIIDRFDEPAFVCDRNFSVLSINREFKRYLSDILAASEGEFADIFAALRLTQDIRKNSRVRLKSVSGREVKVELDLAEIGQSLILIKVRDPLGAIEELHHQRLETLGLLAGTIAHDFNNILTGILGHVSYLRIALPASGSHVESLAAIEDGARKSALMTQQILNFSRSDANDEVINVNLGTVLESTCLLLKGSFSRNHTLRYSISKTPLYVRGIEGQIAQVFINLVVNAKDALDRNGKIDISLSEKRFSTEIIDGPLEKYRLSGKYACLSVTDDGHGMSDEVRSNIFKPYFSTKKGKGTGLGLTTVATVVKQLNGAIQVESKMGAGTTVNVYLPLATADDKEKREEPREALVGGRERILVVDDEASVRNVISLSLQRLGYEVEVAASGSEAIEKYSGLRSYDLVILDMIMPHLSGTEVFFRLQDIDENVNVLISTAYTSEDAVNAILKSGGRGIIQKPFSIDELAKKVRGCLE